MLTAVSVCFYFYGYIDEQTVNHFIILYVGLLLKSSPYNPIGFNVRHLTSVLLLTYRHQEI